MADKLIGGVVSQKCLTFVFSNPFAFSHSCYERTFIDLLNVAVILGAALVKIPQVLKIVRAKNVAGLNEASFVIEVFAGSLFVAYNIVEGHPLGSWGEVGLIVIQCIILVLLFWCYNHPYKYDENRTMVEANKTSLRITYSLVWFFLMIYITQGFCPASLVPMMGLAPVPCTIGGRLPQIIQNWQQKHTGQLSALTMGLSLTGNFIRVLTTLKTIDDYIPLVTNVASILTNGAMVAQILWYRKNTARLHDKKE